MIPNSVSLNVSFTKKLDSESSKTLNSIIFIKKGLKHITNQNTNLENYPKKYYQNEQYIMTNLYHSIKENMLKNRLKKGNNKQDDKKIIPLRDLEKLVHKSFVKFYNYDAYYNIMKIDEIINNEKSHLVAEFKDFLVLGDTGEFILKYYKKKDTNKIYKQILDYYNENLFIFPNYVALYESKYIYNNIQKKQKIIDIQEELNDNKKEKEKENKKAKNENKDEIKVFSVKEIDSILNETNTSAMKKVFGISENNTENGIDKNEKQLLELIDKINVIEKNNINNNNDKKNQRIIISNGNNSKEKKIIKKEKIIKGRNEKISLYGQDKSKSISDMKITENKTLKQNNTIFKPNIYLKNNKTKIAFINSINEKNKLKEKSRNTKEKILEKDINQKIGELSTQTKKKFMENLYNKDKDNHSKILLNKIMNSTKNISILQDNYENTHNGMNKSSNKIIINKNILKEIGDDKNKGKQNLVSSGKNRSYKKELINILFSSKSVLNDSKKMKYNNSKNNTSKADNVLTLTITEDKSAIINNHFFRNGQNYFNFKKDILCNKNKISNSCQNIVLNSYATKNKKLNFNKTNIDFFSKRNISYKLIPSNLTNKDNPQKKLLKKKQKHDWLIGSYSSKEINKKQIRKSPDSLGLKILSRNNNKNQKNSKSKMVIGKSPFQNMNKKQSTTLTDRKTKEQINNNLERIDALSRNIRKIKEKLKKSVDSNRYNLSSVLLNNKSKTLITKKENKNFIKHDNNSIKVYLMNKTRNITKRDFMSNNTNLSSFKIKTIKFTNSSRKEKENDSRKKINFKTINYYNSNNNNNNYNTNFRVNSRNTNDYFKDYTISNYNAK